MVEEEQLVALNTRQKLAVPLIEKEVLSHDSRRFRFELPSKDHKLGLPIGKHFFASGRWNGEFVMRPYTPVTGDEVSGYVDLVIKVSRPAHGALDMIQFIFNLICFAVSSRSQIHAQEMNKQKNEG